MKKVFAISTLACLGMSLSAPAMAEEPAEPAVSLSLGADLVSSYIWRGQECGGFSVQPSATVTFNKAGISIGAWASAELFESKTVVNMTEFDLSLSWSPIEALTIGLTDYHFYGGDYFGGWKWNAEATHNLELNLGYDFGPVALAWNTCLTGPDHHIDSNGAPKRNYGTYVEISAPYKLGGVDGSASIGARLWDDGFTAADGNDKFNVCNITLSANKEFLKIPFMGQVTYNPQSDHIYFVVGVSF